MDPALRALIVEYCEEGYLYLYNEKPAEMAQLEQFLGNETYDVDILYRRTDYAPFLNLQIGDTLDSTRVSSWSLFEDMPNAKYEKIASVMLVISDTQVHGRDIANISGFTEEEEVLLAPTRFRVVNRKGEYLYLCPC